MTKIQNPSHLYFCYYFLLGTRVCSSVLVGNK